jgi:CHU_C Type IX secretion signal domain
MFEKKRHIALFVFIASVFSAMAITNPPAVLRACLDRTNSTLTVYFKAPSDACNSFTKYELYGRDNASNAFSQLTTLSVLNSSQIVTVLPNKKKWELFITALYACNGTDTLYSDTIFIDDQPPAYIEPDSVSVDLATQQLRAGWSKAPEPDVMGYWIYKQDAVTGNNILLDEQNVLTYLFGLSTFDTKKGGNKVEISAFDSCRNGGVISNVHSPILLNFNTGQNINYLCTRKLFIDWSAYVGWPAGSYDILVWDSKSGIWKLDGTVTGGTLSYIYNIPAFGESYSFTVRAHNVAGTISSLSNRIDITLLDFAKPAYNEIGHVSVVGSTTLEITGKWEFTAAISKVILQSKAYGSAVWNTIATPLVSAGFLKYIDNGKLTSTTKYDYRLVMFNSCGTAFDTSATHTNIVLRKSAYTLSWNAYWGWKNKTEVTDLLYRPKQSFTWNTKNAWPDSSEILIDTTVAECYRVASILTGLNNKPIDTAWSNEICLRVFDTTLIPDGFSPGGLNPIFKIINPNLEPGQATMLIFNRWGQKQFEGDALTGWDGKDNKGEFMGPGFYPYLVNIKTPEKRESRKGVVMIIR